MIDIRNVQTPDGRTIDWEINSPEERLIDGSGLTLFPGLIDPHVHFRTPGLEHKEDWKTAAQAAIRGGITTVFDMPNTLPPTITHARLKNKIELIEKQLKDIGIPLRYYLYFGADKSHFQEIPKCKDEIIGIKIFMGSSTGDLVMDDDESLEKAFKLAAELGLVIAVHAEDEKSIEAAKEKFKHSSLPSDHSKIRSPQAAYAATEKAIAIAKKYRTRLYLLHISTKEELKIIEQAKKEGYPIFAETTPHHLFLTEKDYEKWGNFVQVNPPLRKKEDADALWEAVRKGVIDTIGSDHAPHTREEKKRPYGKSPSGIPGVETTLPLMLHAASKHWITLADIIRLMKTRIEEIFSLPPNDDIVLVDLKRTKKIVDAELKTKCGWSPYAGWELKGWPVYTILKGKVYETDNR